MTTSEDIPDPTLEFSAVGIDPAIDSLERFLLGGPRSLTRVEVAERAGVPQEQSEQLWRALGFSRVGDDDVMFGYADVHALQLSQRLFELDLVDEGERIAMVRTLGRSYARLAEWQTGLLAEVYARSGAVTPELMEEIAAELVPLIEELQGYVWRRALLAATGRMLLRPAAEEGVVQTVGFADIVGYTSQSRRLSAPEFEDMMEHFEHVCQIAVTENNGRIIKTIGDEILFVTDEPAAGARIALTLTEAAEADEEFPSVRVGLAHGPVLERLGDVYGSVVNLASRLTTLARPGKVLVDQHVHDALEGNDEFAVRRTRRMAVKGFDRVEPYRLKRPRLADPDEGPVGKAVAELREVIEETIIDVSPDVRRRR